MVKAPGRTDFTKKMAKLFHDWMPDYYQGGKSEEERLATRTALIKASHKEWPASRVLAEWPNIAPRLAQLAKNATPRPRLVAATPRRASP